jgi:hypothetical protein
MFLPRGVSKGNNEGLIGIFALIKGNGYSHTVKIPIFLKEIILCGRR